MVQYLGKRSGETEKSEEWTFSGIVCDQLPNAAGSASKVAETLFALANGVILET